MNRIGQAGRRIVLSCVAAAASSLSSASAIEPAAGTLGAAKISGPVAAEVADPFATLSPIPTPIVTSSGRLSEPTTAAPSGLTSPAGGLQPLGKAAEPTNVIEAGKLVPVTQPTAAAKPQANAAAADDKLPETETAGLKPIQPASISRSTMTTPKAKPTAVKKPAAKTKPAEKSAEQAAPAVNFSFPQPVIPLESAVRRFFKWSGSRR